MIYTQLTINDIVNDLLSDQFANWTYEGATLLAEYLDDLSDEIGDFEFNRVAIRCEWSELSETDLIDSYGHMLDQKYDDKDDAIGDLIELIQERSFCIEFETDGKTHFLVQEF